MSPDDRLIGKEKEYERVGLGFIGGGREGLGLGFTVLQNRIAHNRSDILKVDGVLVGNLHAEEERFVCVPEDSPSSHL